MNDGRREQVNTRFNNVIIMIGWVDFGPRVVMSHNVRSA